MSDLIDETQKSVPAKDEMGLVWWLPSDFWRLSIKDTPGITPAQAEEVLNLLDTYTVVIVLDGHMNGTTAVYRSEAVTRGGLTIRDGEGNLYRPLSPEQLGDTAKMLSGILKPMLAQMAGPLGANMRIFYFPGKTADGKPVVTPRETGTFSVSLRENEFRWRLPLNSLVPKKICPSCKEKLSGNYKFCPFDGEKLP